MASLGAEADALLTGKIQGGLDHAEEVNEQSYLTMVTLSTCFFHQKCTEGIILFLILQQLPVVGSGR